MAAGYGFVFQSSAICAAGMFHIEIKSCAWRFQTKLFPDKQIKQVLNESRSACKCLWPVPVNDQCQWIFHKRQRTCFWQRVPPDCLKCRGATDWHWTHFEHCHRPSLNCYDWLTFEWHLGLVTAQWKSLLRGLLALLHHVAGALVADMAEELWGPQLIKRNRFMSSSALPVRWGSLGFMLVHRRQAMFRNSSKMCGYSIRCVSPSCLSWGPSNIPWKPWVFSKPAKPVNFKGQVFLWGNSSRTFHW